MVAHEYIDNNGHCCLSDCGGTGVTNMVAEYRNFNSYNYNQDWSCEHKYLWSFKACSPDLQGSIPNICTTVLNLTH